MWALVLPIDVAKTRLQTASPGSPWDVGLMQQWAMVGGLTRDLMFACDGVKNLLCTCVV